MTLPTLPPASGENPTAQDQRVKTHHLEFNLAGMTLSELLSLRNAVEQKLPARDLRDINMERELVLQLMTLQELQARVLAEEETPANQMAQVANSLSSALGNLAALQSKIYSSERIKRIEQILLDCLRQLPAETVSEFMDGYERVLEKE